MKSDYIWFDGEMIPYEDATVHILNPTMHYGPGVFEGIRCYRTDRGPAVFRLPEHLKRFIYSIHILGFENLAFDAEHLRKAVHQTIQVNGFSECYIRPLMFLDGPLGINLDNSTPVIAIAAWPWEAYLGKDTQERGARMMVSSFTRMHPNASMTKAKINGQYVNSMLAKTLAVRFGFDEAILLDPQGFVAEGSGENVFMVKNGALYTPPLASVLDGLTRDTLMTLAHDAGYEVIQEPITRDQLYIADELFVCGTAVEIVPVCELDTRTIGSGRPGPITQALRSAFFDTVRGKGRRSEEYLDYPQPERSLSG